MTTILNRYPELKAWLTRLANTEMNLSLHDWNKFIDVVEASLTQKETPLWNIEEYKNGKWELIHTFRSKADVDFYFMDLAARVKFPEYNFVLDTLLYKNDDGGLEYQRAYSVDAKVTYLFPRHFEKPKDD